MSHYYRNIHCLMNLCHTCQVEWVCCVECCNGWGTCDINTVRCHWREEGINLSVVPLQYLLCTVTFLSAVFSKLDSLMVDLQVYVPPWEVLMGSKCRISVVVFPSMTVSPIFRETSEPSTSWSLGSSHWTEEGRSEVTVHVRVCFPPADRGLEGPEISTS